jgi:hypothetical protein
MSNKRTKGEGSMSKNTDPELRAMKRMTRDLETLPNYAAKLRVLEYLYTRLIETAETPPAKPHLVESERAA